VYEVEALDTSTEYCNMYGGLYLWDKAM
jgi:hypothetical protein